MSKAGNGNPAYAIAHFRPGFRVPVKALAAFLPLLSIFALGG